MLMHIPPNSYKNTHQEMGILATYSSSTWPHNLLALIKFVDQARENSVFLVLSTPLVKTSLLDVRSKN